MNTVNGSCGSWSCEINEFDCFCMILSNFDIDIIDAYRYIYIYRCSLHGKWILPNAPHRYGMRLRSSTSIHSDQCLRRCLVPSTSQHHRRLRRHMLTEDGGFRITLQKKCWFKWKDIDFLDFGSANKPLGYTGWKAERTAEWLDFPSWSLAWCLQRSSRIDSSCWRQAIQFSVQSAFSKVKAPHPHPSGSRSPLDFWSFGSSCWSFLENDLNSRFYFGKC